MVRAAEFKSEDPVFDQFFYHYPYESTLLLTCLCYMQGKALLWYNINANGEVERDTLHAV